MPWVTPATWTSGQLVSSSDLNTQLRDQLNTTAAATMTAQGDLLIASAANTPQRLAKDTNSTRVLTNTGTSNNPAWAQVALATGVSGTLPVANGGSGATTLTANGILIGNGTSAISAVDLSTKGTIIAGDGSGNPSGLAIGANTLVLTADSSAGNGMAWASANSVNFQEFTANGTWTKPAGEMVIMELVGGGGGGGGSNSGNDRGGGGGAGGSLVRATFTADELPSSLTVVVGAGGTAGGASTDGGQGGTTTVSGSGFTLSAFGGGGGGESTGT